MTKWLKLQLKLKLCITEINYNSHRKQHFTLFLFPYWAEDTCFKSKSLSDPKRVNGIVYMYIFVQYMHVLIPSSAQIAAHDVMERAARLAPDLYCHQPHFSHVTSTEMYWITTSEQTLSTSWQRRIYRVTLHFSSKQSPVLSDLSGGRDGCVNGVRDQSASWKRESRWLKGACLLCASDSPPPLIQTGFLSIFPAWKLITDRLMFVFQPDYWKLLVSWCFFNLKKTRGISPVSPLEFQKRCRCKR